MKKAREDKIKAQMKAETKAKSEGGEDALKTGPGKDGEKTEEVLKELSELSQENEGLVADVEELKKKLQESEDYALRLRADFDNYRKRSLEEKEKLLSYAGEGIFKHFLKIYDSYYQALSKEVNEETTQAFLEGFKLIKLEMDKFLEEHQVTVSTQVGDTFDPNIHQAILYEESEESGEEKVKEIFQQGYLLNDRLLREAMVKVVKPKSPDAKALDPAEGKLSEDGK